MAAPATCPSGSGPSNAYQRFVERTMTMVLNGMETEDAPPNASDALKLIRDACGLKDGHKALLLRYVLGQEDHSYLQAGLSILWSTNNDEEDTLAPTALYQPDGTSGVRRGLLTALRDHRKRTNEKTPRLIQQVAHMLLALFASTEAKTQLATFLEHVGVALPPGTQLPSTAEEVTDILEAVAKKNPDDVTTQDYRNFLVFAEKMHDFLKAGYSKTVPAFLDLMVAHKYKELFKKEAEEQQRTVAERDATILTLTTELTDAEQNRTEAEKELRAKLLELTGAQGDLTNVQDTTKNIAGALLAAAREQAVENSGLLKSLKALSESGNLDKEESATINQEIQKLVRDAADSALSKAKVGTFEFRQLEQVLVGEADKNAEKDRFEEDISAAAKSIQAEIDNVLTPDDRRTKLEALIIALLHGQTGAPRMRGYYNATDISLNMAIRHVQEHAVKTAIFEIFGYDDPEKQSELERLKAVEAEAVRKALDDVAAAVQHRARMDTMFAPYLKASQSSMDQLAAKLRASAAAEEAERRASAAAEEAAKADPANKPGMMKMFLGLGASTPTRTSAGSKASASDVDRWMRRHAVRTALARGLVGQRGPLCPESQSKTDKRLPYACAVSGECASRLHVLAKVRDRDRQQQAQRHGAGALVATASTDRTHDAMDPMDVDEFALQGALAAVGDDLAVIGETAAHEGDDRLGVERAHEVRWMPTGEAATAMASAAVLEHLHSTCARVYEERKEAGTHDQEVQRVLAQTAMAAKLAQTPLLVSLRRCAALDDPDVTRTVHPDLPLVTRPCAVLNGTVLYPEGRASVAGAPVHLALRDTPEQHYAVKTHLDPLLAEGRRATLAMHRAQRMRGLSPRTYVAIDARETPFVPHPAPAIGVGAPAGPSPEEHLQALVRMSADPDNVSITEILEQLEDAIRKLRTMVARAPAAQAGAGVGGGPAPPAAAMSVADDDDPVEIFLQQQIHTLDARADLTTPLERRRALQDEFLRNVSIASDRLWVFIRTLSGFIGDDITAILTMADESAVKASKALQEQRTAIAKRVSDTQAKIVETVVSGMMKDSKLSIDKDLDGQMVIVNSETRSRLDEMARGDSGRPFFEANVAFQHLVQRTRAEDERRTTLTQLMSGLAQTGREILRTLEATLNTEALGGGPSLLELSHPTNSLFVHLKPDTVAAIRNSAERLNVELGLRNVRRLSIWELCEGGNSTLTNRFCDLVGHVLVQARSSTGATAMYTSQQAIMTNAMQANVALVKLTDFSSVYATRVAAPALAAVNTDRRVTRDIQATLVCSNRSMYMQRSRTVVEQDVVSMIRRKRGGYGGAYPNEVNKRAITMYETAGRTSLLGHRSQTGWAWGA